MGTVNGSYPILFLKKMKRLDRERKERNKGKKGREKGKGEGAFHFSEYVLQLIFESFSQM